MVNFTRDLLAITGNYYFHNYSINKVIKWSTSPGTCSLLPVTITLITNALIRFPNVQYFTGDLFPHTCF